MTGQDPLIDELCNLAIEEEIAEMSIFPKAAFNVTATNSGMFNGHRDEFALRDV